MACRREYLSRANDSGLPHWRSTRSCQRYRRSNAGALPLCVLHLCRRPFCRTLGLTSGLSRCPDRDQVAIAARFRHSIP
jgi:hypothetical protein